MKRFLRKHLMDIMNGSYAEIHFPCKLGYNAVLGIELYRMKF